jgi:predicted amidohydrolase
MSLKISLLQADIDWKNKQKNFSKYEELISGIGKTDLIILPEMFPSGYNDDPQKLAEEPYSESYNWMKSCAAAADAALSGSYMVRERGHLLNRWIFVDPSGKDVIYDKRHLFKINNIENIFTPGKERVVLNYRGIRICPNICYDLRFPVWSRNRNDYDLLINSANWPSARRDIWITLLKARAIENICFVAGANRTGRDGAGINYCGDSMIVGPKGEIIANAGRKSGTVVTAEISISQLNDFRKSFPAHLDADDFTINI